MLGAVIIPERGTIENGQSRSPAGAWGLLWSCIDMLGRPVIARVCDELKRAGVAAISLVGNHSVHPGKTSIWDPGTSAALLLASYGKKGFDAVLIVCCGAYAEFDVAEMSSFHRDSGEAVIRAFADDGPLDLWVVDPARLCERELILPALREVDSVRYPLSGYVNRLETARDFRRLVLDSFNSRCRLRPLAPEMRPGVWMSEGSQIERSARVVAPAFIGRNVKIEAECLITRGTNVEMNSHVDFGTAVEDSSILANSYVGIGLDLSHSIVNGKNLVNLHHDVALEITDPVVMRVNTANGDDRWTWTDFEPEDIAFSSAE